MAKKNEEIKEEVLTDEVVAESKPAEVSADFGRVDLNALRDAVNFLIRRA